MTDDQPRGPHARGSGDGALGLAGLTLAALLLASGALHPDRTPAPPENAVARVTARRCEHNPLIVPSASPGLGDNLNGPSLLQVPDWVPHPLGRYYLYFGHHHGTFIRMAYADELCGPWTIHEPGVLPLAMVPGLKHHLASPDVHVDEARREILLYVHGRRPSEGQDTALAISRDGLHFTPVEERMGLPYLRRFEWRGEFWAVAAGAYRATPMGAGYHGALLHSVDGRRPFSLVTHLLARMRHSAVLRVDDRLLVFFTRIGDAPERILVSSLDLSASPADWALSPPREVLRPEEPWEGTDLPLLASQRGPTERAHQLRDPAIHQEAGRTWLFYAGAGESGIGLAEIEIELRD
jgi:hypothetical protein